MMNRAIIIVFTGLSLVFSSVVWAAGSVEGIIKRGGVPLVGVEVEIRSTNNVDYNVTILTDANGFFSMKSIPMGHFTVTLFGEDQQEIAQKGANIIAAGDMVTINFQIE